MMNTILNFVARGLFDLPWWGYLAILLSTTHVTIAAVTIFLHRHQAHRALDLHPAVSHFFRFWLWLTTGMVTREWVAVHRKHHAHCETRDDPHSPFFAGIGTVLWRGAELYRAETARPDTLRRFGTGTPDDALERRVYRHPNFGVGLLAVIEIGLLGAPGLALWGLQMIWIPFFAAGIINGLGHWWGYRNFETRDRSTNISPLGWLIGGEELHNNHHAFPASAKLSIQPWEFDIGWGYIRLLEWLGLARVRRVAPPPPVEADRQGVDMDTLRAVIRGRFHVMRRYAREVILPVVREELRCADRSCRRRLRQARRLVLRHSSLLDEAMQRRLEGVLDLSQRLRTVYQFRERLQLIWTRCGKDEQGRLEALQAWCAEAEATGIQALAGFAERVRRLVPVRPRLSA